VGMLLVCQQKVPTPSLLKGAVMVAVTGLHVPAPPVGVTVGVRVAVTGRGVFVRVGVLVGVNVGPPGVIVRVGVRDGVGEAVGGNGVKVAVGGCGVFVGPQLVHGVAVILLGVAVALGGMINVAVGNGVPGVPL